jgi:hypothetical protein
VENLTETKTDLQHATHGEGPLLQRDYWAVLAGCRLRPSEVIARVKSSFCSLPPEALVEFEAPAGVSAGADLAILIKPGQRCAVRVVHEDAQSLTLGTLAGHPEAGRITFGAYRNTAGEVIFHIRSQARSSTAVNLVGFLAIGEAMQTNTWTDFINRTAALVGARIDDAVHAETQEIEDSPGDSESADSPTYRAVGD